MKQFCNSKPLILDAVLFIKMHDVLWFSRRYHFEQTIQNMAWRINRKDLHLTSGLEGGRNIVGNIHLMFFANSVNGWPETLRFWLGACEWTDFHDYNVKMPKNSGDCWWALMHIWCRDVKRKRWEKKRLKKRPEI